MYPLQSDQEDLQDVLWCINLLSPKYSCKKVRWNLSAFNLQCSEKDDLLIMSLFIQDRVVATIQELLSQNVLTATTPLSPRNIHALLSSLVHLLYEQSKSTRQEPQLQLLATEVMERIRIGDLGLGNGPLQNEEEQALLAQVAFLRGLIECLRSRDHNVVHFVLHELIPVQTPLFVDLCLAH